MARTPLRSSHLLLPASFLLIVGLWACSSDAPTGGRTGTNGDLSSNPPTNDVVLFPIPPLGDFCGGGSVATILDIETDTDAGVAWSANSVMPSSGGRFNMNFANLGPGPITFVSTGAWSIHGEKITRGVTTAITMTPTGSTANFWDRGFGGTFNEGTAWLFCAQLDDIEFKSAKHRRATAHFDVSFTRAGVLHSIRVNVHTTSMAE